MRPPAPWLSRWIRAQAFVVPIAILIALWIPGCDQGWFRTDSHKYTALALNCWTNGPLWAPQLGDQPYFNKPPLVFWIVGALLKFTGPQIWAVRLVSLVAAIGATAFTVDIARRLSGRRVALLTGIVLATTIEFFRYTRAFSLDLWLTCFIAAAAWCVVAGVRRGSWTWILAAAVPIGAALMVKPFIVLFPVGLLGVWMVCTRSARHVPTLIAAAALGVALAAPWHVAMVLKFAHPFVETYFGSQTAERLEGTLTGADANPWWYYLAQLPRTYLPWILTLIVGLIAGVLCRFRGRDMRLWILSALWIAGWVTVTSLVADRRTRYLIPVYPLMAPISGLVLARMLPAALRRSGRVAMLAVAPGALAAALVVALLPITIHKDASTKWPALVAELESLDEWTSEAGVWCSPAAYTNACNVYLRTGKWLRLAGPDDHRFGLEPPIGAVVLLFDTDLTDDFADLGPILWSKDDLRLVRLERPWPGYERR